MDYVEDQDGNRAELSHFGSEEAAREAVTGWTLLRRCDCCNSIISRD